MLKILIVDDEPLARDELRYLLEKYDKKNILYEAESLSDALVLLLQERFDVVFLDIQLRDESGLTLADHIQKMPDPPVIIFATAYDQYAVDAFDKNARDYLLKPYEFDRLVMAMNKIKSDVKNQDFLSHKGPKLFPVMEDERIYMVSPKDIIMIEALQGKCLVHTITKQYQTHDSLVQWQDKLPDGQFLRVHRSYLVNSDKITVIEPWFNQTLQLTLANQIKVPVSRANVKWFKETLGL